MIIRLGEIGRGWWFWEVLHCAPQIHQAASLSSGREISALAVKITGINSSSRESTRMKKMGMGWQVLRGLADYPGAQHFVFLPQRGFCQTEACRHSCCSSAQKLEKILVPVHNSACLLRGKQHLQLLPVNRG